MAVHEGLEDLQIEGIPGEGRKEGTRTWELAGTHLLEEWRWGRWGEGSRVLLPAPATFWSARLCLSRYQPPYTPTVCSPGRGALAWEQPALCQVLPLSLPACMTLPKPLDLPKPPCPHLYNGENHAYSHFFPLPSSNLEALPFCATCILCSLRRRNVFTGEPGRRVAGLAPPLSLPAHLPPPTARGVLSHHSSAKTLPWSPTLSPTTSSLPWSLRCSLSMLLPQDLCMCFPLCLACSSPRCLYCSPL